jgi:hypothetical protein
MHNLLFYEVTATTRSAAFPCVMETSRHMPFLLILMAVSGSARASAGEDDDARDGGLAQSPISDRLWQTYEERIASDTGEPIRGIERCRDFPGVYVVERGSDAGWGRVVEIISGPDRERVRLPPTASRLPDGLIVVYVDADGVPASEAMPRGREVLCLPHIAEHAHTRYVRARGDLDRDPESSARIAEMITSPDLMEVFAGCDLMTEGRLRRVKFDDWDALGAFLAEGLAVDGPLRARFGHTYVPPGRPPPPGVLPMHCYALMHRTLEMALERLPDTPAWRTDALRALVESTTHRSRGVRMTACNALERLGHGLSCSSPREGEVYGSRPDPIRLREMRQSLGMPPQSAAQ